MRWQRSEFWSLVPCWGVDHNVFRDGCLLSLPPHAPTPTLPRALRKGGSVLLPSLAGEGWDGGVGVMQ